MRQAGGDPVVQAAVGEGADGQLRVDEGPRSQHRHPRERGGDRPGARPEPGEPVGVTGRGEARHDEVAALPRQPRRHQQPGPAGRRIRVPDLEDVRDGQQPAHEPQHRLVHLGCGVPAGVTGRVEPYDGTLAADLPEEGPPRVAALQRPQHRPQLAHRLAWCHGAPWPWPHGREVRSGRGGSPAAVRAGRAAPRLRARVAQRQRTRLGPLRRRVPGHARGVPRRRRLRVGARGPHRGRARGPRRRDRPRRARGGQRRRPVLALGAHARRPRASASTCPTASCSTRCGSTRRRVSPCRPSVAPPPPCPSRPTASTSSSAPSAPCSSSATSTWRSPRSPGCCAREAASPSPITHPTRWMFPDDPGEPGLTATQSYWDRTPYVEVDDASGVVAYVEHHRTLGDWVRLLAASRLQAGRPRRARVARAARPGLGRLVTHPRAADARHRDLRGAPAGLTDAPRAQPAMSDDGLKGDQPPTAPAGSVVTSALRTCWHASQKSRPSSAGGATGAKTAASACWARLAPDAQARRLRRDGSSRPGPACRRSRAASSTSCQPLT